MHQQTKPYQIKSHRQKKLEIEIPKEPVKMRQTLEDFGQILSSRKLYNSERDNSLLKLNKKESLKIVHSMNTRRQANYSVTNNEEVKVSYVRMNRDMSHR